MRRKQVIELCLVEVSTLVLSHMQGEDGEGGFWDEEGEEGEEEEDPAKKLMEKTAREMHAAGTQLEKEPYWTFFWLRNSIEFEYLFPFSKTYIYIAMKLNFLMHHNPGCVCVSICISKYAVRS